jgi:hypothetical protein
VLDTGLGFNPPFTQKAKPRVKHGATELVLPHWLCSRPMSHG